MVIPQQVRDDNMVQDVTGWGKAPTPWLGYKNELTHFCNTRLLSSLHASRSG
jgi:hypothetical protein